MNVIFMSYRREDTDLFDPSGAPAYAPCTDLYTYLCRHFGKDLVFKDNRVIPVGVRFDEYITQHVEAAQVFLELIGPRWASITDEQGKQRLAQPNDMVRYEIITAMRRGIPIIPVFCDTPVPAAEHIPEELRPLLKYNGVFVHHDSLASEMPQFIAAIEHWIPPNDEYSYRVYGDSKAMIPPLIRIPTGPFTMGADTNDSEQPAHQVTLPDYSIAAHPVTVEEYRLFVEATKHAPPASAGNIYWTMQLQHKNHPVVNVTWHDAVAYAAWLRDLTGQAWHLPSEAQWEKAARGTDSRLYPWGNEWNPAKANTSEGGRHATTKIKSYPQGKSSYGVWDMAGNVWEWTASLYQPYSKDAHKRYDDLQTPGSRVRRGGSWCDEHIFATTTRRLSNNPSYFQPNLGFRLALG